MGEHSKYFSPSSISRRIACNGSAFLEDEAGDKGASPVADYGTYGHYIAEQALLGKQGPELFLNEKMFGQVCDKQLIDCVNDYLADVQEVKGLYVGEPATAVEGKVNMSGYGMPEIHGTADLIIDEMFGTLTIMDLKTGSGVNVTPDNNAQLMTYALCCAGSVESLMGYDLIRMVISQPRAKSGGKSLKIWEVTPDVLDLWLDRTLKPCYDAIKKSTKETASYNPGDEACMWCNGKDICTAYAQKALALAKVDFSIIEPVAPIVDAHLVAHVYPHIKLLKSFIKQVEAKAYELVQANALDGFKLVHGRRSRSWHDDDKAVGFLKDHDVDPFEQKLLTPAKAEKLLSKSEIKHLVKVSDGKPVTVPVSDKRKAISSGFEVIK